VTTLLSRSAAASSPAGLTGLDAARRHEPVRRHARPPPPPPPRNRPCLTVDLRAVTVDLRAVTVDLRAVPFGVRATLRDSALLADVGRWLPLGGITILAVYCLATIDLTAADRRLRPSWAWP
jgi:hypothetical protein